MRDVFLNLTALTQSDWFKNLSDRRPLPKKQVLKSLRVEDEVYRQTRPQSMTLDLLEEGMLARLPTAPNLSRDVFQSFYSLSLRHNEESELEPKVRRFNRYLLDKMMQQPDFPAVKALCEGKPLPSIEAAEEFMQQISDHLDELLAAAGGDKNLLDTLSLQEQRQTERLDTIRRQAERKNLSPSQEKRLLQEANRAFHKGEQLDRLNQMVRDNLLGNKPANAIIRQAAQAAFERAAEVQQILRSWGDGDGESRPADLDRELLAKVRGSGLLLEISKYLGRMKEMVRQKRANAFSYGRGEKYSLELGNDLNRVLTSEFSMLALPQTIPLFLRKYQKKALKQYARREKVSKGRGHKIVCLDQSSSTSGENAAWGKAVAYAMLMMAGLDKANFALIRFARRGNFVTDHYIYGQYTVGQVMEDAQNCGFLGGGTDFETPLAEAVRLMEENGYKNADVAFITDGCCGMSVEFTKAMREKKAALGFHITGILMDQDSPGMEFSLTPFCDEILRLSEMDRDTAAARIVGKFA